MSMVERTVFIYLPGEATAVPAGRLTMVEDGNALKASTFAYGRRYVARANALPVDPVSLALSAAPGGEERLPTAGLTLFGALRDATPDAWGRRVIENRLRAPPNGLPESVYLDYAGPHRAGALDVRDGVQHIGVKRRRSSSQPCLSIRCARRWLAPEPIIRRGAKAAGGY